MSRLDEIFGVLQDLKQGQKEQTRKIEENNAEIRALSERIVVVEEKQDNFKDTCAARSAEYIERSKKHGLILNGNGDPEKGLVTRQSVTEGEVEELKSAVGSAAKWVQGLAAAIIVETFAFVLVLVFKIKI